VINDNSIQKQIKQAVRETDDSAMVILFGSRARGNSSPGSDWDILILINKPSVSVKDEQIFRHKLYDLELKINEPISTFVYSLKDWNSKLSGMPLYKNIQKEGIIL